MGEADLKTRRPSEEAMMRGRFDSFASLSSGSTAFSKYTYSSSSSAATSWPGSPADYECDSYSSGSWSSHSSDAYRSNSSSVSLRTNSTDSVPSYDPRPPVLLAEQRSRSLQAIPQKRTQSNPEPDGRDETVRQRRYGEGYVGGIGSYPSSGDERHSIDRRRDSTGDNLPGIGNLLGSAAAQPLRTSPQLSRTVLAPGELSAINRTMPIPLPLPASARPSLLTARHNSLPVLPPANVRPPLDYRRPLDARNMPPAITPSPPAFSQRPRNLSIASEDAFEDRRSSRYPSSSRTPSPAPSGRGRGNSESKESLSTSAPSNSSAAKPIKRKFPCTICGKYFTTSGHLSRHGRTHTGEKNYECPYKDCGSRFSRQDNCMQHYRTHMADESRRRKKKTTGAIGTAAATASAGGTQATSIAGSPPTSPTRACALSFLFHNSVTAY